MRFCVNKWSYRNFLGLVIGFIYNQKDPVQIYPHLYGIFSISFRNCPSASQLQIFFIILLSP